MFMNADVVVKAVMIGLAFASLVTWTIWLAKTLELFGARLRAQAPVEGNSGRSPMRAVVRSGGVAKGSSSTFWARIEGSGRSP